MMIPILTDENYYEDRFYFSASEFKRYANCELDGAIYKPIERSTAMMVGSYVDAYVEGTLDKFIDENGEELFYRDKAKGLKKDYQKAEEICRFIDNDKVIQQFLSGEKQTILTGEISGVPFKIKMDSYSPSIAIVDLKVVASVTDRNGNYKDFITPWGYDLQLAIYQEIVLQNTGEQLPCYILAVTKENPINSIIVNVEQHHLDTALYRVESNVQHYQAIKTGLEDPIGCGACGTCIENREVTGIVTLSNIMGGENYV